MKYFYFTIFFAFAAFASTVFENSQILNFIRQNIEIFVDGFAKILFYEIFDFPFLVLWLVIGGLFFTFRLGFVNIRLFSHAIEVVRGKYSNKSDPGEVSHLQALVAAVSATVGLGNIAGVAIAVSIGGPGAVIWMVIAGFFAMSAKFAEVTLGQKYRKIDKKGKVSGGAFHYLEDGLSEIGLPKLGKLLAVVFAIFCIGGSLGGGNMFQSHEAVSMISSSLSLSDNFDLIISSVLAVSVGVVLIGGIRRIAIVAEAIVPVMAFIYIFAAFVVIFVNVEQVPSSISLMFKSAFDFSGESVYGGVLGAIIAGFRRAAFSNEAGLGSAPIAHAAAKTNEPVREGCVAILEPFIDTVVICFITGIIITLTGVYEHTDSEGAVLTAQAFATVIDWFPIVLTIAVTLFAYSTIITWSYYGERCWKYLFGKKFVSLYYIIFCFSTFVGGALSNLELIINLSDLLILSMAIPNLIGLYLLSPKVKLLLDDYIKRLKNGEFKKIKKS